MKILLLLLLLLLLALLVPVLVPVLVLVLVLVRWLSCRFKVPGAATGLRGGPGDFVSRL